MTHDEFNQRFEHHPLGAAFKACRDAQKADNGRNLNIFFITAKTTIHLLKYQDEITEAEEAELVEMLYQIVDEYAGVTTRKH